MIKRSVAHHTFVIERRLEASPQRVYNAWSDPDAKRRWAACDPETVNAGFSMDFRPHGFEMNRVVSPEGHVHLFQGHYLDIVPNERIIYAYDIHVDGVRITASMATVLFEARERGTRLLFTEQIVFLDGHDALEERIHGTGELLDMLERELGTDLGEITGTAIYQ